MIWLLGFNCLGFFWGFEKKTSWILWRLLSLLIKLIFNFISKYCWNSWEMMEREDVGWVEDEDGDDEGWLTRRTQSLSRYEEFAPFYQHFLCYFLFFLIILILHLFLLSILIILTNGLSIRIHVISKSFHQSNFFFLLLFNWTKKLFRNNLNLSFVFTSLIVQIRLQSNFMMIMFLLQLI